MQQQWRLRVKGTMRTEVDVNLLVQAVIALGEQLHAEAQQQERERDQSAAEGRVTPPRRPAQQQEQTP